MPGFATAENSPLAAEDVPRYDTYKIQNDDTSLLFSPQRSVRVHSILFLTVLFLIFGAGVVIGVYLLAIEGYKHVLPSYNFTSRDLWQARPPSAPMSTMKLPTKNILFLTTNSSRCRSNSHCGQLVHKLQLEHMLQQKEPDISYNFVISSEGSIFEGRGWSFQSTFTDYSQSNAVTVAFLGGFEREVVTPEQVKAARLFLDVAVMEGKLERCFNVSIWGGNPLLSEMARNIQADASRSCEEIT